MAEKNPNFCENDQDLILSLEGIEKSFGSQKVLKGLNLQVRRGEFLTLLGSSGCGKTTMLRIIAGMEEADAGLIILNGEEINKVPSNRRNVNMVFQNYALFPHLNVAQNIGYGLKIHKVDKGEIRRKVSAMLKMIQLEGFEKRMPNELSGGQRQRVAIARALINEPEILLLDEPLGALDLQLRRQMQLELKNIQRELGITFIYITHDQEEALNMSDRIAVMRDGQFSQIGTPNEIYSKPKTDFVASFVGAANILRGQVTAVEGEYVRVAFKGGEGRVLAREQQPKIGEKISLAIRPEDISFPEVGFDSCREAKEKCPFDPLASQLCVEVKNKLFVAGMLKIELQTDRGQKIYATRHGLDTSLEPGNRIEISWNPQNAIIVEEELDDAYSV